MDRERVDDWLERGILGLVLAILIYGPLATGAVRAPDLLVIQGLTAGVGVLWLVRLWLSRNYRLLWPPMACAVVLFVGYAIVRYFQADVEYVARQELIRILIYTLLFFAVVNNLHRQESVQVITFALVFLGLAISVYAVYQFMTNSDRVWHYLKPEQYMKRGSGTFICPNHLAGFLEMILPLGLAYTLTGRLRPVSKVLLGYASLVIIAGIAVSISRGGWIASGLALMVLFSVLLRNRDYRLPALAFLAVLVLAGTAFILNTAHTKKRFQEMLVSGNLEDIRFRLWRPALQLWQENPWWGIGPGHFDCRFRQFRPESVQMRPERVHNDYLNTLTDWGVAGAALVASAWILLYVGVFKSWKYVQRTANDLAGKKSNRSAFVLGAAVGLLAILLHSFVDFNMHIPANAILAVTLMALLSSHVRFGSDRYWIKRRWYVGLPVTILILAGIACLGYQGQRRLAELRWLDQAEQKTKQSQEYIDLLERAYAVEPNNPETVYAIGEAYRVQSWQGEDHYKTLAQTAMQWLEKAMRLNRFDAYSQLRYGMCLDFLGRRQESEPYYAKAEKLDPNGYYLVAHLGWHRIQLGDYRGAKPYFERSLRLKPDDNPIAKSYLGIVDRKLAESSESPKP
jgi:O-antigen ligase